MEPEMGVPPGGSPSGDVAPVFRGQEPKEPRGCFGRCLRRAKGRPVKLPETPLILAGAFGGPFGIFLFTPLRNALTLASQNPDGSALDLYAGVFAGGFAAGWTGGFACVPPSCPQFIVMGPLFHFLKDLLQSAPLAVICSSLAETTISFASQTINAQMAFNADQELLGLDGKVELWNPFLPFGPGSSVHVLRNIVALSGLRLFSTPCQAGLGKVAQAAGLHLPEGAQKFLGDFLASMGAAILSAPLNQLFNFAVTSNEFAGASFVQKLALCKIFLAKSYLIYADGRLVGISPTLIRDLFMRCAYIANLYALFGLFERLAVALWRRRKVGQR
ncbi:unnamed protein product [Effrenium voratum]|uniref:Uncharacterized protein n=1 Tax=Effrenium voratum TaxID=2562239 RepID=A0AA36IF41_9DINO|nr:unnamed protein product [Effrenium voratum]CAJ1386592.1 unnamed protein product [Effrenium voratum]CAJ1426482.1 unnamed protein product [Effrenium voratum]